MDWIDEIASDDVLRQAYDWLCERRVDYSPNDDVWDVRWRWEEIRPALQDALRAGDYRMSSVRRFSSGRETIEVWSALNALVLKATSIVIAAHCLPELSMRCYHIEGRGGAKAAVRFIDEMRGDSLGERDVGGAQGRAAPRQDVHRPDQSGVRFSGLCVLAHGARGGPAGGGTLRGTCGPALFMSAARTWSASGPTFDAGNAGRGAVLAV